MKIIADTNSKLYSSGFTKDLSDIYIYGFDGLDEVHYKTELNGKSNSLKLLANHSKDLGGLVLSGIKTDNFGIKKLSVALAYKGMLMGICTCNTSYTDSSTMPSYGQKIFDTRYGKIGIIVGDDLYNIDYFKALAICSCDCVFCLIKDTNIEMPLILERSYSYLYGLPTCLITANSVYATDGRGQITYGNKGDIHSLDIKFNNDFNIVCNKTKFIK